VILVSRIDLRAGVAELRAASAGDRISERVVAVARGLGLRELRVIGAHREPLDVCRVGTAASTAPPSDLARELVPESVDGATRAATHTQTLLAGSLLEHTLTVRQRVPTYAAVFWHDPASLRMISAYTAFLLSTHPAEDRQLLPVRLAAYEICANVVEHGRTARDGATLQLHLQLEALEITGSIQDQCAFFDPGSLAGKTLQQRMAERQRRGYGIPMLLQLLDRMEHEFNDVGNRITFSKRMEP
jgi:anti-sigma regulatory factor (Ser/Thr protein kinase)